MTYLFNELSTYGPKFIVEPSGTELTGRERDIFAELRPGAVMFRSRNFLRDVEYKVWLEQYGLLLQDIRSAVGRDHLMVCIDHEGGRIIRPPLPITKFPYPAKWSDRAAEVGKAMGVELRSLGINLSFSPVADIHSNPRNPVINQRAFGRTADEVVRAIIPFVDALFQEGVAACAKHFPGHGDTSADSHFALPVLGYDYAALKHRELVPFKALIDHGVSFIMTAHLMFPAIDPNNPATFSRDILTGVLRQDLKFDGVIIADAMGMKAVVDDLDNYETTVRAVNAGLDLYCVAGDSVSLESAMKWAGFMRKGVENGDIPLETMTTSIDRISCVAEKLPQHGVTMLSDDVLSQHKMLAQEVDRRSDWSQFDLSLPGFE